MDTFSCTSDRYDSLYARWLTEPGQLLDLAGWQPTWRLLDLCGGTGIVAREAIRRGAEFCYVVVLDNKPRCPQIGIQQVVGSAESLTAVERALCCIRYVTSQFPTVVVCRQAIGYLNPDAVAVALKASLRIDDIFVFNAPARPPVFSIRQYIHAGARFLETHIRLWQRVIHLQARLWPHPGIDISTFRWHPRAVLESAFRRWFSTVTVQEDGRSLRFRCIR